VRLNMQHYRIDPIEYPIKNGESWWIVNPNNGNCLFKVPCGAITLCLDNFKGFIKNVAYRVVASDDHNGWVTVLGNGDLYDMPQYLFSRYFDAESFVVGIIKPEALEKAKKTEVIKMSFKDSE